MWVVVVVLIVSERLFNPVLTSILKKNVDASPASGGGWVEDKGTGV